MDLGVDDYMVLAFVQWYDNTWRIVGEYWNNGYALTHYLDYVRESDMDVRVIRFPHDIKVREFGAAGQGGKAKSRYDIAREYKERENFQWRLDTLPRTSVEHGIEVVRRIIPSLVVDSSCTYIKDCMQNYSKEWDDKLMVWKKTPVHDEFSHGADVLRMIASNTIESSRQHQSKLANNKRVRTPSGYAL